MSKHFGEGIIGTVLKMRESGYMVGEIAKKLGFERIQIERLLHRHSRKQRLGEPVPKRKGRPPSSTLQTKQDMRRRIISLEREVELLRSFLQAAGRR